MRLGTSETDNMIVDQCLVTIRIKLGARETNNTGMVQWLVTNQDQVGYV